MKHKIIFLDLDGTTYQTEQNIIQQSTIDTLSSLRKQGCLICAATGRGFDQTSLITPILSFNYYVLINGAYIIDSTKNVIHANPISNEKIYEIIKLCEHNNFGLLLKWGDSSCIYRNYAAMHHFCKLNNITELLYFDKKYQYHLSHPAYAAIILFHEQDALNNWINKQTKLTWDKIKMNASGDLFDIFNADVDKANGIEILLKKLHLSWKDTICIGDSTNDIQMLERADIGIAMGNASNQVKEHADFVTSSVFDNGIANALTQIKNL